MLLPASRPRPALPSRPAVAAGRRGNPGPTSAACRPARRALPTPDVSPAPFGGRMPDAPYVCLGEGLFGER